jgi:hypothetical protein
MGSSSMSLLLHVIHISISLGTQFFHRVANSHRKFNHVDSLNINGATSKNPVEIQEHIF